MGNSEVSMKEGSSVELLKVGCAGWWFVKNLGKCCSLLLLLSHVFSCRTFAITKFQGKLSKHITLVQKKTLKLNKIENFSKRILAHSNYFFFCTRCWLDLLVEICSMELGWRKSPANDFFLSFREFFDFLLIYGPICWAVKDLKSAFMFTCFSTFHFKF